MSREKVVYLLVSYVVCTLFASLKQRFKPLDLVAMSSCMLILILKVEVVSSLLVYRLVHALVIKMPCRMTRESWVRLPDREISNTYCLVWSCLLMCGCIATSDIKLPV